MRIVIVGYGTQGKKRHKIAKRNIVAIVDPNINSIKYNKLEEIESSTFDAVFLCVPDNQKIKLIEYCIKNKKHVLVEKPIICKTDELLKIQKQANNKRIIIYTAYNHRFEPHIIKVKKLLDKKKIGKIYNARIFYGNGTARLVRNSVWRDAGSGVINDLGSHLLDLYLFLFNDKSIKFSNILSSKYENKSYDHSIIIGKNKKFNINMEMSMCSWKNEFFLDIFGSTGSIHIKCLCKWGPSTLTIRKRVFPSGIPYEKNEKIKMKDPTWEKEFKYFLNIIKNPNSYNLVKDIWINNTLKKINI